MAIIMQAHCLLPTTYCPPPTRVRTTYYSLWRSSCRPTAYRPLPTAHHLLEYVLPTTHYGDHHAGLPHHSPPYHLTTYVPPYYRPPVRLLTAYHLPLTTYCVLPLRAYYLLWACSLWPISSQSRAGPHEHRRCRDRDLPPAAQGVGGRHGASMGPMHESFLTLPLSPPTQPYPLP
jgi:hypothetical protein